MPGVYDDEKTKEDQLREITGVNKADEKAMEASAHEGAVRDQEASGATPQPTQADKKESDRVGKGYTGGSDSDDTRSPRQRLKGFKVTRSKAILGGGLATLLVGGVIGISSITQGPFKLIHAGQLLQRFHFSSDEEFMDSRVGKLIRWSRTRGSTQRRNLGYFGNLVADRYEQRLRRAGVEPEYRNQRITTLTFDTNNGRALEALNEMRARGGVDIPDPDANGRVRVELPTGFNSTRQRRSIFRGAIGAIGQRRMTAAMSKRILTRRAGIDWHPFRNIAKNADEQFWDFVRRVREDLDEKYRAGEPDADTRRIEGAESEDADGNRQPNAANDAVAGEAADIVGDGDIPDMKGRITRAITGVTGAAGAATLICALDQLGDSIPVLRQANVVLPLMRYAGDIVSMGNQVMSGQDFNLDEVGAIVTSFYDENAEAGSKEFFGAKTFQAELGQEQTGVDMPNAGRPNTERPQVFQVINTITATTGVAQVCSFVTSTAGGWVVDIADWATSGGPAQALVAATTDILTGALLSSFVDDLARWLAGEPLDLLGAAPGVLGNYANFGSRLLANEGSIAHGGTALSPAASLELREETEAIARAEFQQKSLYDRYLNPYESRSLAAETLIRSPDVTAPTSTIATFVTTPSKLFGSLSNNLMSAFSGKTIAQGSSYDYGFPEYGFSLDMMDNPRYEDPFENAERVEPNLADYNERFGDCFGTTVDPETFEIRTRVENEGVRYDLLDAGEDTDEGNYSECDTDSQDFNDYRMYLADQYALKSMTCYESLDENVCTEVIVGTEEVEPSDAPSGPVASPGQDTSGIPCPSDPDITDGGVAEKYGPGRVLAYRIRVCILFGDPMLDVNVSIAQNAANMFRAASQSGLTMRGGGYRTFDEQVALRSTNGCPDTYDSPSSTCATPTARPGSSNHEAGEAIDITCNGSIIQSRSTACFQWLDANASDYGLFNLPSEAWHWSIDGS